MTIDVRLGGIMPPNQIRGRDMFTKRTERDGTHVDAIQTRTEIRDLSDLGPELDERELAAVVGGFIVNRDTTTDPHCGGCH
jgi:hypothetical protein